MMKPFNGLLAALLTVALPLGAQHSLRPVGEYLPAVPTPRSVLGYDLGDRFTQHHVMMRYLERLTVASPRVTMDTIAWSFEGRELPLLVITSERNHGRMEQILRDAATVADPASAAADAVSAAAGRLPVLIWLGYTVHGNEASGTEAALALAYQLAAGTDPQTLTILDSAVVLLHPLQNPDGHERHAQDVWRATGALGTPSTPGAMVHVGSWPGPRTSHYYFDLNRDWFMQSHPESRGRIQAFLKWWPHVAVDLHEMGSNSTYFFPPPMDPVNKNTHRTIVKWWDIFGDANARAFDGAGLSFFRREGYDLFYAGFGDSWPVFNGAIGMTYEQASSAGGAIRRSDGTVLTLRNAAFGHYTAAWATVVTAATRARERVSDYLEFRRAAISDNMTAGFRAVAIERDSQGRADSLVALLQLNGIRVQELGQDVRVADATPYGAARGAAALLPARTVVVDLAQPQGNLARALLEPDAELDSTFIAEELERRRTGRGNRFYDVTAWSLPYMFRVQAHTLRTLPPGLRPVSLVRPVLPATPTAVYGYAIEPGSEASYRLLGSLLADSVRMMFAREPFRSGDKRFENGAFVLRNASNTPEGVAAALSRAASLGVAVYPIASGAADEGPDLGSGLLFPVRIPKVALLGGDPVSGQSFGYAWYTFDQRLAFRVTNIPVAVATGSGLDEFNVLVVPSVSAAALDRVLGDGGRTRVANWVRAGGVLIALDAASSWLAAEATGLSRFRSRRDTSSGPSLPASVPGAIVRTVSTAPSPLLAGIQSEMIPALLNSDRIYTAPRDVRTGEVVLKYESRDNLLLAGYIWPEVPERVADSPLLWTERVGSGRVIAFANDPNYRDMYRGFLPFFANAVFLGGSF